MPLPDLFYNQRLLLISLGSLFRVYPCARAKVGNVKRTSQGKERRRRKRAQRHYLLFVRSHQSRGSCLSRILNFLLSKSAVQINIQNIGCYGKVHSQIPLFAEFYPPTDRRSPSSLPAFFLFLSFYFATKNACVSYLNSPLNIAAKRDVQTYVLRFGRISEGGRCLSESPASPPR